jgi:hypothetical protein
MESKPNFHCKLIRQPELARYEVRFPEFFTKDRAKFGAIIGRVERELQIKSSIRQGNGLWWIMPDTWFFRMPTAQRIVTVLKETFDILLGINLVVEVSEAGP